MQQSYGFYLSNLVALIADFRWKTPWSSQH